MSRYAGETSIQVIKRAALILRACRDLGPGLSLGDIARQTGLPRSTVQRIVTALIQEELLQSGGDARSIRLGRDIFAFADSLRVDVVEAAHADLKSLSEATGETVDLARFHRDHMVFVNQIAGAHRLRAVSAVGEKFPLHCTANGKAALSLLNEAEFAAACAQPLTSFTASTLTSLESLRDEIACVRRAGIAYDRQEHTLGICAMGAAFRDFTGAIYAISIPVPSTRFEPSLEAFKQPLLATMGSIAASLNAALSRKCSIRRGGPSDRGPARVLDRRICHKPVLSPQSENST